ncbi:hypothetical protein MKX03_017399 [Papaver bracteatum]|nr:hypothetical protein MKX03_017399 [Papaver bracteatum]
MKRMSCKIYKIFFCVLLQGRVSETTTKRIFQKQVDGIYLSFKVSANTSITVGVLPSLNPPNWTRFVPLEVYLLLLEKKLVHPPLHKLQVKCIQQRRIMISTT